LSFDLSLFVANDCGAFSFPIPGEPARFARARAPFQPSVRDPREAPDMIATRFYAVAAVLALVPAARALAEVQVEVRGEVVDLADQPLSEIPLGSDFRLNVYVKDLRPESEFKGLGGEELPGVFSAFVETTFDPALAASDGPPVIHDFFPLLRVEDFGAGFIRGGGAAIYAGVEELRHDRLLFSAPLQATGVGPLSFSFAMNPNQLLEWLLYGTDDRR
jgi:hypothetical protein